MYFSIEKTECLSRFFIKSQHTIKFRNSAIPIKKFIKRYKFLIEAIYHHDLGGNARLGGKTSFWRE